MLRQVLRGCPSDILIPLGTISRYPYRQPSPDIHVRLEEHGTAVWELIDGKRTVRQIIEELAEHFDHEENYESRITAYITQLQKDGFVKLAVTN